jgi:hypothetical protein
MSVHYCDDCGREDFACECLNQKGNVDGLDHVVIAYRSLADKSVCRVGSQWYTYEDAMEKMEQLSRLYDGKVRHFVVPPEFRFTPPSA